MEEVEASAGAESSLASRAMHVCIVFRVAGVQQNSCCVLHVWEPCPCHLSSWNSMSAQRNM